MAEIVSVVWYKVHPDRFGGQKGIAQFNRCLSAYHRLTCLCAADNDPSRAGYPLLPQLPIGKWQFLNPINWIRIWRVCRQVKATHLLIEHPPYGLAGRIISLLLGIRMVLHAHNIESEIFRKTYSLYWRMAAFWEGTACRSADLILFKTSEDRDLAVSRYRVDPNRTHIVPFGVLRSANPAVVERQHARLRLQAQYGIEKSERLLYFGGTLDYGPNAEVIHWLYHALLPELRKSSQEPFRLIITGRREKRAYQWIDRLEDTSCIHAGDIDDTNDLMLGADLLVNPVVSGSGIKVKNMEAIAAGLTVVTTGHGARGIDRSVAGPKLVVAETDDVAVFARAVIQHWRREDQTPEAFYARYHWPHVAAHTAQRIAVC